MKIGGWGEGRGVFSFNGDFKIIRFENDVIKFLKVIDMNFFCDNYVL